MKKSENSKVKIKINKLLITCLVLELIGFKSISHAQNRGFNPPGTSFGSNPFAGRPPSPSMDDEEDSADDEDIQELSDDAIKNRMEQQMRDRGGKNEGGSAASRTRPPRNNVDFEEAGNEIGATSMKGGANTKVSNAKASSCLKLDPYTGEGPDIVTNFDFPDADIVEIAKTLGKLTCLNFLLDKDVKGRISVVSNSPITVGDAWKAFLTALDVNGFTIIPSGAYLRIARHRDAKDKQIKTYSGKFSPNNDLYITRVLPLKYISADEVARVFRNFMPPNTRILSYDQTNTVMITDTAANIKKIVDMIALLDVEGFDEKLEVIRIRFATAQDIAKLIDQLLPGGQNAGGNPGGAPGIPRFRSGSFAARKTKEGGVISHIIPDDRTNSVIVSANSKGLDQVKELIVKLDAKVTDNVGGSKIHVVYLQFADSEQVANTLNSLAQAGSGTTRPTTPIPGSGAPVTSAQLFEGSIKISADKPTNSLVITGTPSDFGTINRVISKLDVPRDQVYVESVIMEMTIEKGFELGLNVVAPNAGVGFVPDPGPFGQFLLNPLSASGFALGFAGGKGQKDFDLGNNQKVTVSSIQGLIKALQTHTNTNVLATPQILTLDNQEATIEIGETVPVPVSTAIQGAGVARSIDRQKVSLSLKIKPQINKISNFVKLDIDQKIEDFSDRQLPPDVAGSAFGTNTRSSKTTVVVQDGDTVAMGGLVRDKVSNSGTKIPILGDIPILGWLFQSKKTSTTKQNLIVFMTPKIIKQYQNIRGILDKKIRERDEFMERNAGADDPFEYKKMDMIRELPDVSTLKSGGRVENAAIDGVKPDDSDSMDEDKSGDKTEPPAITPPDPLKDGPSAQIMTPSTTSAIKKESTDKK